METFVDAAREKSICSLPAVGVPDLKGFKDHSSVVLSLADNAIFYSLNL